MHFSVQSVEIVAELEEVQGRFSHLESRHWESVQRETYENYNGRQE
jgi:hypothetical protein